MLVHWFNYILKIQVFNRGQKSGQGIKVEEEPQKDEVDFAIESAIYLLFVPLIPEWLARHP